MAITIKEKAQLVLDVISRLETKLPENTDYSDGTVLKTIIESLMEELDIQYWQLEQVYDNAFIDYAYGSDLDKVVALLGVTRRQAVKSIGKVTFYRSTPATTDYFIPAGTVVATLPDKNGVSVSFETTKDYTLLEGETEIEADVECMTAGTIGNVSALTIKVISNPPSGIESVKNDEPMSGGVETQTDAELRETTKHTLDAAGLGTISALFNKIRNVAGVREVSVIDMARGIGTVDIFVLADTIPMTEAKKEEIEDIIKETKAGGIDVILTEPNVLSTNVTVQLVMEEGYNISNVEQTVINAIKTYIDNLDIGEVLIVNQLKKYILNSSDLIVDLDLTSPLANIDPEFDEIVRTGTITIT